MFLVKLKLLIFFVRVMMQKVQVQNVVSIYIQSDCETMSKREQTHTVFTRSGKVQKGGEC